MLKVTSFVNQQVQWFNKPDGLQIKLLKVCVFNTTDAINFEFSRLRSFSHLPITTETL